MPSTWTVADPSLPALTFTYSFGPGLANALALPVQGGALIVSPPYKPSAECFDGLEAKLGKVVAIVAPNAVHTMGLAAWAERYPDAKRFAPAASIARVEKVAKVSGFRPSAEAAPLLGDGITMVDMPHHKMGEALVRWKSGAGWAWYVTDVLFNFTQPVPGPFGLVLRLTKSAPGLRRNMLAAVFASRDRKRLYPWLVSQAETTPPVLIVPCHGDTVRPSEPVEAIRNAVA